ncbi:phosphatase PAP2 family protein [Rhodococcus oxybenzonivorans]|uniref:phosphatase PAP2 family protein n=1 Tax=Rhodococcus oxybenzonivorans TaxID=1990687 RepID=UPI0029533748|nr:phosphatase PAP2 family protein [Rhodococcus oxybenzonivorans]MDV7357075.1 phosphatase PAP2 family protein [Rhodococcus oxybenzonivorans]
MPVDSSVLNGVIEDRPLWLVDLVTAITNSGGTVAAWIISVVLTVTLLRQDRRRDALLVGGAMLSGWAVMSGLKQLFRRDRPPLPERLVDISTYSFPSGHAMMTAILACVVGTVVVRLVVLPHVRAAALTLLGLYTLMVGLSRVYLAAHWITDVLAGWVFGALWAAVWILLTRSPARTSTRP